MSSIRSEDVVYSVETYIAGTPVDYIRFVYTGQEASSGYTPGEDDLDDPQHSIASFQWIDIFEPWPSRATQPVMAFDLRIITKTRKDINDNIGALRLADRLCQLVKDASIDMLDRTQPTDITLGHIVFTSAVASSPGVDARGLSTALCEIEGWAFLS